MAQLIIGKVVGDTGPQGIQGVDGPQGLPGEQGVPGVDGSNATVTIANDLIQTVPGKVLDATQGKVINDALTTHKAESVSQVGGVHGLVVEYGTWTPNLIGVTTPGTPTFSYRVGRYTRIGKKVECTFQINLSSKGGMVGEIRMIGLPFASQTGLSYSAFLSSFYGVILPAGVIEINPEVRPGEAVAMFPKSGGSGGRLQDTELIDTAVITGVLMYQIP